MARLTKAEKLKRVAYHEAGHAVANIVLQRSIEYVTIIPDEECLGHVKKTHPNDYPFGCIDIHGAVCTLAGVYAEKKLIGRFNHLGAHSDYLAAFDILSRERNWNKQDKADYNEFKRKLENDKLSEVDRYFTEKAVKEMEWAKHSPENTDWVYPNEVVSIFQKGVCKITELFIEQHWDKIVSLANALLERETLSREEVKKICR